jgi:hypothetical protein
MLAKLLLVFFLAHIAALVRGQNKPDTSKTRPATGNADDPSQFLTRIEVSNELQHYNKTNAYLNQTVFRTVVKVGKRFTTRLDVPYVHNSFSSATDAKQTGLGDISFRLLGYRFFETKKSAFTMSIEISLNTAESSLLGTGKTLLIPLLSYSKLIPRQKMLFALLFQQVNSVGGDEARSDLSFSKLQAILIKYFSKRTWAVLAPEWFLDYINGGLSMNLRTRLSYALTPRINIWATPSAGIFGDFQGRYQWSADVGVRYFIVRKSVLKKQ